MAADPKTDSESPEPSDEELGRLFQNGSQESGDRLYTKYRPDLLAAARRFYPSAPEDLLHDTFVTVNDIHRSFGPPYQYKPWFVRVLHNNALNWIKAYGRTGKIFGPEASDADLYRMWRERTREDRIELAQLLTALTGELNRLAEPHRKIGLYMLDCLAKDWKLPSKREIEQATGIPASTAERRSKEILDAWKKRCQAAGFWPLT